MEPAIADRIPVIDIDTHVAEPPDLWTSRLPSKWGDRIPHVTTLGSSSEEGKFGGVDIQRRPGDEIWVIDGKPHTPTALLAWSGHDEPWPGHTQTLAEAHPAAYDGNARIKYMDETGVRAMAIFPNIGSSNLYTRLAQSDPEFALDCCRAYNDFLSDWCSPDPNRLLAQTALPLWDVDECAREIQRCAAKGHKSVMMTHQADGYGLPWLSDAHWDPIWSTAQEIGLPICFHIDAARPVPVNPKHDSHTHLVKVTVMSFLSNSDMITEVILSGLCHRFPRLNFVSVESGAGFIPYLVESMDWQWINLGMSKLRPELDLLPSEYFRRQVYGSFWFEQRSGLAEAIELFPDNLFYETDFPHPTSISPGPYPFSEDARQNLDRKFSEVTASEQNLRKILCDNALRVYNLEI